MGKGNRNREVRISDVNTPAETGAKLSKLQLIKQQEKKAKTKKYITMAASLVIVISLVLTIVLVSVNNSTKLERTISATSDKYQITNSMMAYLTYSQYQNYLSEYSSYIQYFGLDTSKSLKAQMYPGTNISWFVYFMNSAKVVANEIVALASEATDKGYILDEEDKKEIQEQLDSLAASAKANGYSSTKRFLSALFCPGVTVNGVRQCLEIQTLAGKYQTDLIEAYEFSDEEIEKYLKDHPEHFLKYDYMYYTFLVEVDSKATDAEKKAAIDKAKAEAEEFMKNSSTEELFKANITVLEKLVEAEKNETATGTTAATGSATGTGTGSDSSAEKDYTKDFIREEASYVVDDELSKWANEEGRKAGELKLIENKNSKDEISSYSVYYLLKPTYKDEYASRDIRHILVQGTKEEQKTKADEILAEFNKGEKTAEAFAELAKKYSEDPGSVEEGGLYEKVLKKQMVDEFNDWLFDDERKANDTGIVKTEYGYHVMFYVGENTTAWKVTADAYLESEKYEEDLEALIEKHPITYDDRKLAEIP